MSVKVWVVKGETLTSKSLPADIESAIESHNCVIQPEYYYSLAEFTDLNSFHQRCMTVKSNCVAGLGYKFMGKNYKRTEQFIENLRSPERTFDDIMVDFWYDYELFGSNYIELARAKKELSKIFHMSARDIYQQQNRERFWQILPGGKEAEFAAYQVEGEGKDGERLHELIGLRQYTPRSGYYGLPRYLGSLMAVSINKVIADYNFNFFDNHAIPDLAIIVEGGEFDKQTEKEIQEYLQDNIKGVTNAHKTLYIPVSDPSVKVRIEKLNEARDGHFRFLRNDNRDEILTAHGVPPRLAGVIVSGSMGGSGEQLGQLQAFLQTEIKPKQRRLEAFLNMLFKLEFKEDPGIKFNELDITSALEDAQRHQIYNQGGILTEDEIREELGREPLNKHETKEDKVLKSLRELRKAYAGEDSGR